MSEKNNYATEIINKALNNLGIDNFPHENTNKIKEKLTILTNDEKAKLLSSMDKETLSKVKNALDTIQR